MRLFFIDLGSPLLDVNLFWGGISYRAFLGNCLRDYLANCYRGFLAIGLLAQIPSRHDDFFSMGSKLSFSRCVLYEKEEIMMEIDEALKTRYGTERPFTVPDAYFDRVEEEVMRSVAADAAQPVVRVVRKSLWKQLSPLVAAACVVGVIVLVGLGVSSTNPQGDMAATVSHAPKVSKAEPYTDDLDRLADYTMMDEDDAYAYISGE